MSCWRQRRGGPSQVVVNSKSCSVRPLLFWWLTYLIFKHKVTPAEDVSQVELPWCTSLTPKTCSCCLLIDLQIQFNTVSQHEIIQAYRLKCLFQIILISILNHNSTRYIFRTFVLNSTIFIRVSCGIVGYIVVVMKWRSAEDSGSTYTYMQECSVTQIYITLQMMLFLIICLIKHYLLSGIFKHYINKDLYFHLAII